MKDENIFAGRFSCNECFKAIAFRAFKFISPLKTYDMTKHMITINKRKDFCH